MSKKNRMDPDVKWISFTVEKNNYRVDEPIIVTGELIATMDYMVELEIQPIQGDRSDTGPPRPGPWPKPPIDLKIKIWPIVDRSTWDRKFNASFTLNNFYPYGPYEITASYATVPFMPPRTFQLNG